MKKSRISLNIIRRRPLAATAAAFSLASCTMFHPPAAAPSAAGQAEAEKRVKAYQSDIESALDRVDRDRLRAAAEKKNTAGSATAPGQVILASAGAGEMAIAAPSHQPLAPSTPIAIDPVVVTPLVATPAPAAASALPLPRTVAPTAPAAAPAVATAMPPAPAAAPAPTAVPLVVMASPATNGSGGGGGGVPTVSSNASVAAPSVPPTAGAVIVAPLSGDAAVSSAVIAPFTPPVTPGASAMVSMTALVMPTQAMNAEPSATPTVPAEASLDGAMNVLRKSVGEHPTLNTALALALLDGDKAGDAFKKLPEADQKLAGDLLTALDAMKARVNAATLAERAAPIVDAAQGWQETADLALPRLVLATRVDSFGVFTPITGTFEQGKRHTVIIYCEVANFASKKGDDGWYSTKLTQQETLFTEDGLLVWRPNAEDVEDRSLNQRHDFYLVKKLTIPETLAAGKYTLRMNVTDRNTNKIKIVEMPIEIVVK